MPEPPARGGRPASFTVLPDPQPVSKQPVAPRIQAAPPMVQRDLVGQDLADLKAFYDREISAIGNPTYRKHRAAYQTAVQAASLEEGKELIRTYIREWHRNIDREARGVPDSSRTPSLATGGFLPLSSNDLTSALGPHERPTRGPSSLSSKEMTHFNYAKLNQLDPVSRIYMIAELASGFGSTIYEMERRRNVRNLEESGVIDQIKMIATILKERRSFAEMVRGSAQLNCGGQIGIYYRYHKFTNDPISQQFVFGGGFNKSEITKGFQTEGVKKHFKKRHDSLEVLTEGSPMERIEEMQRFQANAFSTPFIATTADRAYAMQLLREYPPEKGQTAALLTIVGPTANTFDFEKEFAQVDRGFDIFNKRTTQKREKDGEQAEFGIPDIFIPVGAMSPLGFVIADVQWLARGASL